MRRALESRLRDLQQRLGSEPGDEGWRLEVKLALGVLREVEALERLHGFGTRFAAGAEALPDLDAE